MKPQSWCLILRCCGLRAQSTVLFVGVAVMTFYSFMFLIERANFEIVNWIFACTSRSRRTRLIQALQM